MPGSQIPFANIRAATSYVSLTEPTVARVNHEPGEATVLRFHVRAPVMSRERLALTPATLANERMSVVDLRSADDPEDAEMMQEFIDFICKAGPTVSQVFLAMFELHDFEILAGNAELHAAFAKQGKTFGKMMDAALDQPPFDAQLHQLLKTALAEGGASQALARGAAAHPGLNAAMTRIAKADPGWDRHDMQRLVNVACIVAWTAGIAFSSWRLSTVADLEADHPGEDLSDFRQISAAVLGTSVGVCLALVACLARTMRKTWREQDALRGLAAVQVIGEAGNVVTAQDQSALEDQLRVIEGAPSAVNAEDEPAIEIVVRMIAPQAEEIGSLDPDDYPALDDASRSSSASPAASSTNPQQ